MAIRTGDFDEADGLLASADSIIGDFPDVQQRGTYLILAAELALLRGDAGTAYELAQRGLEHVSGSDDELYTSELMMLAIQALADQYDASRLDGARFDLDKGRLLAKGLAAEVEDLVAAVSHRGGQPPPRVRGPRRAGAGRGLAVARVGPRALGRGGRGLGSGPTRPTAWRCAAAARPRPCSVGGPSRRIEPGPTRRSREAWRVCLDLGALPLRQRIEDLARRARIELGDDRVAPDDGGPALGADLGITPREVEVLGQLAAGRTDREIAESLFISKKTASVHVSNLLRKLQVSNRVEAGRIGQAHGLG